MSQPPGPYGQPGAHGQPGSHGQPGAYGQPQGPYGQPGAYGQPAVYGRPGAYGGPGFGPPVGPGGSGPGGHGRPPKSSGPLPWVLAALAVVLLGVGVLVVALFGDEGAPTASGASSASTAPSAPAMAPSPSMRGTVPSDVPGGAGSPGSGRAGGGPAPGMDPTTPQDSGDGRYPGSADLALEWMNGIAGFDEAGVFLLSCADLRQQATDASVGTEFTPEEFLTAFFYSEVLDGQEIVEGESTGVSHDDGSALDVVAFDLQLADGSQLPVFLGVDEDLTVCGFA